MMDKDCIDPESAIKLFGIANQMVEHDLDRVEAEFALDLMRGHRRLVTADETYYPQIERGIRVEAASMAPHYEVFYSLEATIRRLIAESFAAEDGPSWWGDDRIPPKIREDAESRQEKERDTGMTPRSSEPLDFTTFGELGEIIKSNWDVFGGMMSSMRAVERVMANLNSLRGPIAHCSPLAEDEVVRLQLAVRDWFRLLE